MKQIIMDRSGRNTSKKNATPTAASSFVGWMTTNGYKKRNNNSALLLSLLLSFLCVSVSSSSTLTVASSSLRTRTQGVTNCGCEGQCTSSSLNRIATDITGETHTCRDRMNWVMKNYVKTQYQACLIVSNEFPNICGIDCNPSTCKSNGEMCNCLSCTSKILDEVVTDNTGSASCRNRIYWAISNLKMTEVEACTYVSNQFPFACGQGCNPFADVGCD